MSAIYTIYGVILLGTAANVCMFGGCIGALVWPTSSWCLPVARIGGVLAFAFALSLFAVVAR